MQGQPKCTNTDCIRQNGIINQIIERSHSSEIYVNCLLQSLYNIYVALVSRSLPLYTTNKPKFPVVGLCVGVYG